MGWISETMRCAVCKHTYSDLLDRDKRDDVYSCPECGQEEARRTWSVPNVSTEKLSKSIPDSVAKGRFDGLRAKQELRKEKANARSNGDRVSEDKISKELRKLK